MRTHLLTKEVQTQTGGRDLTPIAGAHSGGRLFTRTTHIGSHKGKQAVFYHKTPIVAWDENEIILSTGGYLTASTKLKMNQTARDFGLGFVVYQTDFNWYVVRKGDFEYTWDNPIEWKSAGTRDLHLDR